MSNHYSTEDLIRILAEERQACMNGHRLNLAATPSNGVSVIDHLLQTDGIQKFTAYNDFRATVHQYQREHQVSGLVWQSVSLGNETLRFPRIDDQLVSLSSDRALLRSTRPLILSFWQEVTRSLELFLSLDGGKAYQAIVPRDVDRLIQRTDWASLATQGSDRSLEIILQLGWGKPEEATYRRGFPDSGSEYVHAVNPGMRPFC
ncbi:MAG TPA: hypothetical protein V6D18_05880 [Thermosynechococcaceae cyanobacterium]